MHFLKTQLFQKAQLQKVEPNSPSVIHPNQMAKYLEKKKGRTWRWERERSEGTSMASTSMELTDWPNLAPARDRGQRHQRAEQRSEGGWVGWEVRTWDVGFGISQACCFRIYHKINGIGKSICQNLWFFFFYFNCWHVRRVGAMSKKKKKTLTGHRNPASCTRSGGRHRHDAKNGVSMQPRNQGYLLWDVACDIFSWILCKQIVIVFDWGS